MDVASSSYNVLLRSESGEIVSSLDLDYGILENKARKCGDNFNLSILGRPLVFCVKSKINQFGKA